MNIVNLESKNLESQQAALPKTAKIYVSGHSGMVGSAIVRRLRGSGYSNILTRSHTELDLLDQRAVLNFMQREKPDYIFCAAAKVGGIVANNRYRAEFIYQNLMIQANIIHSAYLSNVRRLLFLGSSCVYPVRWASCASCVHSWVTTAVVPCP